MESQNYENLLVKAEHGELDPNEFQRLLVEVASKSAAAEREAKKAIEKASKALGESEETKRWREEERMLMPGEANDLEKAVRKKGISLMGGKDSQAYKNKAISKKIYMDIHYEIKRNYDLIDERGRQMSYQKLKKKYLSGALALVAEYVLPVALENLITAENEIGDMDD